MKFLTKADFDVARENAAPHIHRTPVLGSATLSELTGADVYLKAGAVSEGGLVQGPRPAERFGPHVERRARARSDLLLRRQPRAGRRPGRESLRCRGDRGHAHGAPEAKIDATRSYGAEVVLHGEVWDDAYHHSLELQKERNLTYIHPFDDPLLVAGQGGVGYETIEDVPDLDTILVPIGGGGLISGISQIVKLIKPDIRVIGVEMAQAPAMKRSIEAGHRVTLTRSRSSSTDSRSRPWGSTTSRSARSSSTRSSPSMSRRSSTRSRGS